MIDYSVHSKQLQDAEKYQRLHLIAWSNVGLHLPLTGEKDGDINTIVIGSTHRLFQEGLPPELETTALKRLYCWEKNPVGTIVIPKRAIPHHDLETDFQFLEPTAPREMHDDARIRAMNLSLRQWRKSLFLDYRDKMSKDLSDTRNIIPQHPDVLSIEDVLTLERMFVRHATRRDRSEEDSRRELFIERMGMHLLDPKTGEIIERAPTVRPFKFDQMYEPILTSTVPDAAKVRILNQCLDCDQSYRSAPLQPASMAELQSIVDAERESLWPWEPQDSAQRHVHREWDPLLYPSTLHKPLKDLSQCLPIINKARQNGCAVGFSAADHLFWRNQLESEVAGRMLGVPQCPTTINTTGTYQLWL